MRTPHTTRSRRGVASLLALVLLVVGGLAACDPDAEYTTDKSKARVDYNVFEIEDGYVAAMTVTVTNKTANTVRAEVDLDDSSLQSEQPNANFVIPSGESRSHTFTDVNYRYSEPKVWTRISTYTGNTTLEFHDKTGFEWNLNYVSDKTDARIQAIPYLEGDASLPTCGEAMKVKIRNKTSQTVRVETDFIDGTGGNFNSVTLAPGANTVVLYNLVNWDHPGGVDFYARVFAGTTVLEAHSIPDMQYDYIEADCSGEG